jgi:hypothetical protein
MDEAAVRAIVREEIASLAGKALRRTQDMDFTRLGEHNMMVEVANREMAQFWGEVLSEYGGEDWPVPKVSPETSGIAADYADSAE